MIGYQMTKLEKKAEARATDRAAKQLVGPPPAGMSLDTRGLITTSGLFGPSSRPLQLLTTAQMESLPERTKLGCVGGTQAIQGVDDLDKDAPGGFVAYGFLL